MSQDAVEQVEKIILDTIIEAEKLLRSLPRVKTQKRKSVSRKMSEYRLPEMRGFYCDTFILNNPSSIKPKTPSSNLSRKDSEFGFERMERIQSSQRPFSSPDLDRNLRTNSTPASSAPKVCKKESSYALNSLRDEVGQRMHTAGVPPIMINFPPLNKPASSPSVQSQYMMGPPPPIARKPQASQYLIDEQTQTGIESRQEKEGAVPSAYVADGKLYRPSRLVQRPKSLMESPTTTQCTTQPSSSRVNPCSSGSRCGPCSDSPSPPTGQNAQRCLFCPRDGSACPPVCPCPNNCGGHVLSRNTDTVKMEACVKLADPDSDMELILRVSPKPGSKSSGSGSRNQGQAKINLSPVPEEIWLNNKRVV